MTLADFRGIKRPGAEGAEPQHSGEAALGERAHPGPAEYVKIGLALGIVTAVEVAVWYADLAQWALVTILILLSGAKFSLVGLWFMHLKFDSRLFSGLFVGGLLLAMALFVVVLATFGAGLV